MDTVDSLRTGINVTEGRSEIDVKNESSQHDGNLLH